jgi:hypothetical protein
VVNIAVKVSREARLRWYGHVIKDEGQLVKKKQTRGEIKEEMDFIQISKCQKS